MTVASIIVMFRCSGDLRADPRPRPPGCARGRSVGRSPAAAGGSTRSPRSDRPARRRKRGRSRAPRAAGARSPRLRRRAVSRRLRIALRLAVHVRLVAAELPRGLGTVGVVVHRRLKVADRAGAGRALLPIARRSPRLSPWKAISGRRFAAIPASFSSSSEILLARLRLSRTAYRSVVFVGLGRSEREAPIDVPSLEQRRRTTGKDNK